MEKTREALEEELRQTREELDRILKEQFPLVMSKYLDKELATKVAKERNSYYGEWHGSGFPYYAVNDEFIALLGLQYQTTSMYDFFHEIGEREVAGFLNRYYHFLFCEADKIRKQRKEKPVTITEEDRKEFEEYCSKEPGRWKEPLTVAEYLHMCRIGFDAAPDMIYPDFVSDLYVVAREKLDSCGITKQDLDRKMKPGDKYMETMHYHPEEMGFGGPYVKFGWNGDGWLMDFWWEENGREKHAKNIKRFLAMRKAGYPVSCTVPI